MVEIKNNKVYGVVQLRYAKPMPEGAEWVSEDGKMYLKKISTELKFVIMLRDLSVDKHVVSNAIKELKERTSLEFVSSYTELIIGENWIKTHPIYEWVKYTTLNTGILENWMALEKNKREDYILPKKVYGEPEIIRREVKAVNELQPIALWSIVQAGVNYINNIDVVKFIESLRMRYEYPKKIINPFLNTVKHAFATLEFYESNYWGSNKGYYKWEGSGCDIHSNCRQRGIKYMFTQEHDKHKDTSMVPTVCRTPEYENKDYLYYNVTVSFFGNEPKDYKLMYRIVNNKICLIGFIRDVDYGTIDRASVIVDASDLLDSIVTTETEALKAMSFIMDGTYSIRTKYIKQLIDSGIKWSDLIVYYININNDLHTYKFGQERSIGRSIAKIEQYLGDAFKEIEIPNIYTYNPIGVVSTIENDEECVRLAYSSEEGVLLYDVYEYSYYAEEKADKDEEKEGDNKDE